MVSAARPPGPTGLPWFGTLLSVYRDPLRWLRDTGHRYGPISFTHFGPAQVYMLNDPALIEEMFVGKHRDCIKDRSTRQLASLVGGGLLTSEGDRWRHHRRVAAPPLQPKRIASYAQTMIECTARVLDGFADAEQRNIDDDMSALTLEIAGKTLLGFDTRNETQRVSAILDAAMAHFERQFYTWHGMLPPWVPTRARLRYRAAVVELDQMLYGVVRRCRAEAQPADHLLARLIQARGENGEALSDVEVRDEAVTMLLAGHETTALMLGYACHSLANQPQVFAKLRDENDAVLGGRTVALPDLARLPYLEAVLSETLRLYPSAHIVGREVVTAFEIGGYHIPRGAEVIMSPYSVHHDPAIYPDPERFLPERWLDGGREARPRFAYFPFGGGPRVCIGNHFALMEASIVLAMLIQRFELHPVAGAELRLKPAVTLRPASAIRVGLRRRSDPPAQTH